MVSCEMVMSRKMGSARSSGKGPCWNGCLQQKKISFPPQSTDPLILPLLSPHTPPPCIPRSSSSLFRLFLNRERFDSTVLLWPTPARSPFHCPRVPPRVTTNREHWSQPDLDCGRCATDTSLRTEVCLPSLTVQCVHVTVVLNKTTSGTYDEVRTTNEVRTTSSGTQLLLIIISLLPHFIIY